MCSQARQQGERCFSPTHSTLGHSLLMGNFMGGVWRGLAREHAGTICSQDLGLFSHLDLGVANSSEEQMLLPPPQGHRCVTSWSQHHRESLTTCGRPLNQAGDKTRLRAKA